MATMYRLEFRTQDPSAYATSFVVTEQTYTEIYRGLMGSTLPQGDDGRPRSFIYRGIVCGSVVESKEESATPTNPRLFTPETAATLIDIGATLLHSASRHSGSVVACSKNPCRKARALAESAMEGIA